MATVAAGGSSGDIIVRDEVRAAVEGIVTAGVEWKRAYNDLDQAVKARDLLTERMARRVLRATGGVSVTRWEQQCRRRSIRKI